MRFSAIAGSLLGLYASADATTKNVDIIVTHGAALTTFTFINDSGSTLPAGTPVNMGQGFRYGDILPGNYPVIRDATTHVPLAGQQWDEISTWRENGGNGSWRHAAWSIWLPNSLASGATYTVEFVPTAGAFSETSHQALTALCSGPASHDLKIHLSDVRNQDDTARDSGDATFRLCDNIANVGRDAPRHLRAGNIYDEYEVRGLFSYTSGHKDPLLYATCIVDLFTNAADGTSLKDVRWVCEVHNSWMNVAAGSAGNPGAPGPAGFANDPQTISYRIEVRDGSTTVLDWSRLDQTVASANNPIQTTGCGDAFNGTTCVTVPGSVANGPTGWYTGQAVRVSCTGTCVGGLTNGKLYFVYPSLMIGSQGADDTKVVLTNQPDMVNTYSPSYNALSNTQGTGTTTFSDRMFHPHRQTLLTLDTSADENWASAGSTVRSTRRIYPAFTPAEKLYWEETGLVPPLNLTQNPAIGVPYRYGCDPNYNPFGRLNVIGTIATAPRPDIGIINDYASQAFINGTQTNWALARLFALGATSNGFSTTLNEATGRIPPLNYGAPTGPGGSGSGTAYSELGPVNFTQVTWKYEPSFYYGLAPTPTTGPAPGNWLGGIWNGGTYISHRPQFNGINYQVFGSRHYLDLVYSEANESMFIISFGNADGYRDNTLNGNHYYGLAVNCCQTRGAAWSTRARVYGAGLGGDSNVERAYFNDTITEMANYYPQWLAWKDGPGNSNFTTSIIPPNDDGVDEEAFIGEYMTSVGYMAATYLHAPLSSLWLSKQTHVLQGTLGNTLPGNLPVYYSIYYSAQSATHNGKQCLKVGGVGPGINGTDASDFGMWNLDSTLQAGGRVHLGDLYNGVWVYAVGDMVKDIGVAGYCAGAGVDQLAATQWYRIINVDSATQTFQIENPATPGQPFTSFTSGGNPMAPGDTMSLLTRPAYDPGGFSNANYVQYVGAELAFLKILGYELAASESNFNARGGSGYYNDNMPGYHLDGTVAVPR